MSVLVAPRLRRIVGLPLVGLAGASGCGLLIGLGDDYAAPDASPDVVTAADAADVADVTGPDDVTDGSTSDQLTASACAQRPAALRCVDFDEPDAYPDWTADASSSSSVAVVTDGAPPVPTPPAVLAAHALGANGTFPGARILPSLPASSSAVRLRFELDLYVDACPLASGDYVWVATFEAAGDTYGAALTPGGSGLQLVVAHLKGTGGAPSIGQPNDVSLRRWTHVSGNMCARPGAQEWSQRLSASGTPADCALDASVPAVTVGAGLAAKVQAGVTDCRVLVDNVVIDEM